MKLCQLLLALSVFFGLVWCRRRPCARLTNQIFSATVSNLTLSFNASSLLTDGQLHLRVNWDIVANGADVDGFLIRLKKSRTTTIIPALTPCTPTGDYLWITGPECANVSAFNDCSEQASQVNTSASCVCRRDSCTVYSNVSSVSCIGTLEKANSSSGVYDIVGNHVRSATYPADFHAQYDFHIVPYKREFYGAANSETSVVNYVCEDVISSSLGLTYLQAVAVCCTQNITHLKPINAIATTSVNLTDNTVDVTLSWLPPVLTQEGFTVSVFEFGDFFKVIAKTEITNFTNPTIPAELSGGCYTTAFGYMVRFTGLTPGSNYRYSISTTYNTTVKTRYCINSQVCRLSGEIQLKNASLCDPSFNACDNATSTCTMINGGVQCQPKPTTTTQMSVCLAKPSKCDKKAVCSVDNSTLGFTCTCKAGYTGNGLRKESGAGCSGAERLKVSNIYFCLLVIIALIALSY